MRLIPKKIREEIARDPFMALCIYQYPGAPNHDCRGRITWEHAWTYQGRQIIDPWATVPCCEAHNSGEAMDKNYNRYVALLRANIDELQDTMGMIDWRLELNQLSTIYSPRIPKQFLYENI